MLPISGVLLALFLVYTSNAKANNDSAVLLSFKRNLHDPHGTLSNWNTSVRFCQWNGVTCNTKDRVSGLVLQQLTLSGSLLFSTVSSLPILLKIHVSGSNFTDAVSVELSNACSLEVINLSGNRNVSFANHLGKLREGSLLGCKNMKFLKLSKNQIGQFPIEQIGNVLEVLDLSFNSLTGNLPPLLFSSCKRLRYLDVSHNSFTQALSDGLLENCTSLRQINLAYNNFQGVSSFPSIHYLSSLEFLDASFNNFTGVVPSPHQNLKHLNVSSNRFGTANVICPSEDFRLESLILVNNKLTGSILHSILNCSSLKMLDLSFNSVSGDIPVDICNYLPKLEHFLACMNNLNGSLPSNLASCTNMTMIILSFNNLTGSIPFELLFNMPQLQWLNLNSNNLTGELPSSLGHTKEMLVLDLKNNRLHGDVPSNMTMNHINLRANNLSGQIPASLNGFAGSRRSKSSISGTSLLMAIMVPNIQTCSCSGIYILQGIALEEMENLLKEIYSGCVCHINFLPAFFYDHNISSPTYVDISDNRLAGRIPKELGSMKGCKFLSVAHNLLSGIIPVELGQLQSVSILDLSFNELQGSIPNSFSLLNSLTSLNVSNNRLSGPIPQGAQLETLDPSSYAGNTGLCAFPLAPCNRSVAIAPATSSSEDDDDEDRQILFLGFGVASLAFVVSCTLTVVAIGATYS